MLQALFLLSLNVNFVGKFAISNVVDVVHMSMNIGAKIWCHEFWEFRPKLKGDFFGFLFVLLKCFSSDFWNPYVP